MLDFRVPCGLLLSCWLGILLYACGEPLYWEPDLELFPGCDVDAHCEKGEECYEGRCLVPCEEHEDCLTSEVCGVPVGAETDEHRYCLMAR